MNKIVWLAGSTGAALLLSSCVTYPYDTAFNSCEREANDCYRLCEEIPDEGGYVACQAHCDRDIDRCFDTAYSPYSGYGYGGYGGGYGYGSPWYGRYGSWYPDYGYYMSFNYYDRYGYRKKKHPPQDYRPPSNNPPPAGPPPSGGTRQLDRPRAPNRYYRRSSPPVSGPNQPNTGASAPPPRRAVSPPSTGQTYTPPPSGGSTPTYTPPPSQPPAGDSSSRRAPRREVGPGVSRGEPDPDQD